MSWNNHIQGALDTLRLSDDQLQTVVDFLRKQQNQFNGADLRCEPRMPYQAKSGVVVDLRHPGGTMATYLVRPHNLSSRGMGFLHGAFVYAQTPCVALLPRVGENKPKRVVGQAVRCRHIAGNVHEVGVRFTTQLDLREFLSDLAQGDSPNAVEAGKGFRNAALVIEDSIDDRELIEFMLNRLQVGVTAVADGHEAAAALTRGRFDLVFADCDTGTGDDEGMLRAVRGAEYSGPIIAVTGDAGQDARARLSAAGATCTLIKPFQSEELATLIDMYLDRGPPPEADSPLLSEHWFDVQMRPLILKFLDRLDGRLGELRGLLDRGDLASLRRACLEIKSTAAGYGYPRISQMVDRMLEALATEQPTDAVRPVFEELAELAASACLARGAMSTARAS